MSFEKSQIITTSQLAFAMKEAQKTKQGRFCFILGSGASKESGILSGQEMELEWMNEIMEDPTLLTDLEATAGKLHDEGKLEHPFSEIKEAWENVKNGTKEKLPSEFYFDIYRLRFFANQKNGYYYLEKTMEGKTPSLGYHALALMLTRDNNNLVVTTNFDSLTEDALYLYTDRHPLVAGHESLAEFIDLNIQRPIVAKVHRGLMFNPKNSPEETNHLEKAWEDVLRNLFAVYTPIVVGYGGGDQSLMTFLKENCQTMDPIYWCVYANGDLSDEDLLKEHSEIIAKVLEENKGYLVKTGGFDALMLELGTALYGTIMNPTETRYDLQKKLDSRIQQYAKRFDELNKQPDTKTISGVLSDSEDKTLQQKMDENKMTAWDYFRRAYKAYEAGYYEQAIADYSMAIALDPNYAGAYINRGIAYRKKDDYEQAIADYSRAIELDPNDAEAYYARGYVYDEKGDYEQAIADYSRAIELDPNIAEAYNNR